MTVEPRISVVMPVYGAERWLRRAVDSVLAQTFSDFELILVDDESPDSCGAICDEYAAADSRVRVIHQRNQGVSGALNSGLERACGRWLMFMDDDDEISPWLMETAIAQAQAHPADYILWKYCVGRDGLPQGPGPYPVTVYPQDQVGSLYLHGWFGAPWAMLFDRELVQTSGLRFDRTLYQSQDLPFVTRYGRLLFTRSPEGCFRMIEAGLYHFDIKETSLSHRMRPEFCDCWCRTFDALLTDAEEFYHIPAADSCAIYQNYLRTIGVGLHSILCLETGPVAERRARAKAFLASPRADKLRRVFRERNYFSLYYWPLRLRWLGAFAFLGRMQAENESRYLTWHYRGQAIHDRLFGPVR